MQMNAFDHGGDFGGRCKGHKGTSFSGRYQFPTNENMPDKTVVRQLDLGGLLCIQIVGGKVAKSIDRGKIDEIEWHFHGEEVLPAIICQLQSCRACCTW